MNKVACDLVLGIIKNLMSLADSYNMMQKRKSINIITGTWKNEEEIRIN